MSLDNWVKLPAGKVVCMHFKDYRVAVREITDPFFGTKRNVNGLVFLVDRLDGAPVDKSFSVMSETLAMELQPYLEDGSYKNYSWCFTKDGPAMTAPRIVKRTRL